MDGQSCYRRVVTVTACLVIWGSCCSSHCLAAEGEIGKPASNASRQPVYGPIARLPAADGLDSLPQEKQPAANRLPAGDSTGDDVLGGGEEDKDDLLSPAPHPPHSVRPKLSANGDESGTKTLAPGEDPHAACFATTDYPAASTCAVCHKQIYDEWRVSSHAYASISPMFHKFEQTITELSRGTVGYFCLRCHAPVATIQEYPRHLPIIDAPPVFREGVTCVACHRVRERYGRVNGERRIEPGTVHDPVLGTLGGDGLREVIARKDFYKVKPDPEDKGPGTPIHRAAIQFEQLNQSSFCASCHQVTVHPGIALEVVWAQYRASPARKCGVSCQDCHMGKIPGVASGYEIGPAALVDGKAVNPNRKHSNHAFFGPGYSIAHPGIFPQNKKAERWSADAWHKFDFRAGWGTAGFEKQLEQAGRGAIPFPSEWQNADERMDAAEVLQENFALLQKKDEWRSQVMENGMKIEGPFFKSSRGVGRDLDFEYIVVSTNGGHNTPSGSLGAQPQLWLNAVLTGPRGERIWESGYVDGNGDIADQHSLEVRSGTIRRDAQLFNLQTKFLTTNIKGTDREMYLPVNVDVDPLPFLRPGTLPITVLNHPPLIRMEAHSIAPYGRRSAKYHVPGALLCQLGRYRLSVRMRSRAEPIYFMRFCQATPEMELAMNEKILDVHAYSVEFDVR
jgi:nitrate/TMAO reductase-like tetraheme cytochrome c subunit